MRNYLTFDDAKFTNPATEMKAAREKFVSIKENDYSNYSLFPLQVVNTAYDYVENDFFINKPKTKYDVTVFVGPGDYYLFSCFKKFTETYACELNENAQDWCITLANTLPQRNIKRDNVNFVFKSFCANEAELKS